MKILPNGIAVIEGDTHISKWVEKAGRLDHDQNMLPLLREYIPKGGTVIDVGAFIGDHTVFYAECVGPRGNVIAFEPNPPAFDCLVHNTARYPHVKCLNHAASNELGHVVIQDEFNSGASYAVPGDGPISCILIDNPGLLRCDFIKFDCEGFEVRALKGAFATIRKHRPTMLIEVNAGALERQGCTPQDIFSILAHLNYRWRNIYPNQPCKGPQYDILCEPY